MEVADGYIIQEVTGDTGNLYLKYMKPVVLKIRKWLLWDEIKNERPGCQHQGKPTFGKKTLKIRKGVGGGVKTVM